MAVTLPLTIGIPAYNRPHWLRRNLTSIVKQVAATALPVEIVVCDDSTDPACADVAREVLRAHKGPSHYEHHRPALGMAQNWNQVIRRAQGEYVMILHDDDYLAPGGCAAILRTLSTPALAHPFLIFGVHLVDANERRLRSQTVAHSVFLPPKDALRKLISNSSFIRFPGVVVRRSCFETLGVFNPSLGYPADLEMWIRLATESGIQQMAPCVAHYTIHEQALTSHMFDANVVQTIWSILQGVKDQQVFSPNEFEHLQSSFFHQFVLAGTVRSLRQRQWKEAQRTFRLFERSPLNSLTTSWKWAFLRFMLSPLRAFPLS